MLIDGVDITRLDEDALAKLRGEKIGFVFQFFHLIPSLTALENVRCRWKSPARGCAGRRGALLEEVGLTGSRASLSVAALRRRTAAGRAGPRARERSADRAGRRADRQPGYAPTAGTSWICCARFTPRAARRSCW